MNKRRRLISGLGLAAVVPSFAPAFAQTSKTMPATATPGELLLPGIARIMRAGVLRSAVITQDNPPFFYADKDGRMRGIDVDAASGIARELGVKLVLEREAATFGKLFDQVAGGQLDLVFCKLSRTIHRAMRARLTQPYVEFHHAAAFNRERLATLAKEGNVETVIKSFSGSMGVLGGTTWVQRAKQAFPASTIVEYPDWSSLVEATRSGKVMACYRDAFEVKKLFKSKPELAITLRGVMLTDLKDSICGVIAPDLADLREVADTWLEMYSRKYDVKTLLSMY